MHRAWTRRTISIEVGVAIDLACVLALVLACLAMNYWPVNRWIEHLLGSGMDPLDRAVMRTRVVSLLASSRFTIITAAVALIAMVMTTRQHPWWRWTLIVALPIAYTFTFGWWSTACRHALGAVGVTDGWYVGLVSAFSLNVIVAALIGWIMRSPLVLVGSLAAACAASGYRLWLILNMPIVPGTNGGREAPEWQYLIAPICQTLFAIGFMAWAWRQRRLNPVRGVCTQCGYDLRGTTHARCPECGSPTISLANLGGDRLSMIGHAG